MIIGGWDWLAISRLLYLPQGHARFLCITCPQCKRPRLPFVHSMTPLYSAVPPGLISYKVKQRKVREVLTEPCLGGWHLSPRACVLLSVRYLPEVTWREGVCAGECYTWKIAGSADLPEEINLWQDTHGWPQDYSAEWGLVAGAVVNSLLPHRAARWS